MLDRYLTLAPFGGNLEGVRAASLAYFGKEPKRLTIAEAALLVALPQSPEARGGRTARPRRLAPRATACSTASLARGVDHGRRSRGRQCASRSRMRARAFPRARGPRGRGSGRRRSEPPGRCNVHPSTRGCRRKLETLAKESAARLGPKLSAAHRRHRQRHGRNPRPRRRGRLPTDAERGGALDMSRAPRSPGSALKPFIYALAFEEGLAHPETILVRSAGALRRLCARRISIWAIRARSTARQALQHVAQPAGDRTPGRRRPGAASWRACAAPARDIALPKDDADRPRHRARRARHHARRSGAALCGPRARRRGARLCIERLDGAAAARSPQRITDPVAAWYVADILRGAPPPANALSGRIAFKTGTSYGFRDALAIGFDKGDDDRGLGRPARQRPDAGPCGRRSPRRSCSTLSRGWGARSSRSARRGRAQGDDAADCPRPCAICARTRRRRSPPPRAQALKIAFPPNGARVDLGLRHGAGIAARAQGARRRAAADLVRQWRADRRRSAAGSRHGSRTARASRASR